MEKEETDILAYLQAQDPVLARLIAHYGGLEIRPDGEKVYERLVTHIISQMLSNRVADVLTDRFTDLVGDITPENVISHSPEELRAIGISGRKAEYILQLSEDTLNGRYDFSSLSEMDDQEVVAFLTQIKGVGRWTAEMIAEFTLGRPDIFSYDDVALQNGLKKAYGFKTLSRKRFERCRKKFRPYCSTASLYFYRLNDDPQWRRVAETLKDG